MEGKVIYVDFKSASKKSKDKNKYKSNHPLPLNEKRSYASLISEKLKSLFSRLLRKRSRNSEPLKYKHWL